MPAGYQAFNPNGSLNFDLTDRIGRVLGEIYIAANSSGSITIDTALGTPFGIPMARSYPLVGMPVITVSGNKLSWAPRSSMPEYNGECDLIYGIY